MVSHAPCGARAEAVRSVAVGGAGSTGTAHSCSCPPGLPFPRVSSIGAPADRDQPKVGAKTRWVFSFDCSVKTKPVLSFTWELLFWFEAPAPVAVCCAVL